MAGVPSTYFVADDGSSGRELWRRLPNGEVERVADIAAGATSSDPGLYGGFVEFNGALYSSLPTFPAPADTSFAVSTVRELFNLSTSTVARRLHCRAREGF